MSDIQDLFRGRLSFTQFVEKEWGNLDHLVARLPSDVAPIAKAGVDDLKVVVSVGAGLAGSAVSAFVAGATGNLETEVLNILSGVTGGNSTINAATQDGINQASKIIQAVIANAVLKFQQATAPASQPASTAVPVAG
jgi:hypothetical protein